MIAQAVGDSDAIYRHVIDPIAFLSGGYSPQKFLKLSDTPTGAKGSVAWSNLLPTVEDVHGYGIRLAQFMNEQLKQKGKLSEKTIRAYCGAYELLASSVRKLGETQWLEEIAMADVVPNDEIGEPAHCDLIIVSVSGVTLEEDTKTAIIDRLWHACTNVHRYPGGPTVTEVGSKAPRELPDPPMQTLALPGSI